MLDRHQKISREVDQMLIWEIAVALGAHRTDEEDADVGVAGEPRHLTRARQRAAAIAAGREMPEPEAPSKLDVALMSQAVEE